MINERERDFLQRVADGKALRLADRQEDRLRQRMRKAGFVEVLSKPRRWAITETGRQALETTP